MGYFSELTMSVPVRSFGGSQGRPPQLLDLSPKQSGSESNFTLEVLLDPLPISWKSPSATLAALVEERDLPVVLSAYADPSLRSLVIERVLN